MGTLARSAKPSHPCRQKPSFCHFSQSSQTKRVDSDAASRCLHRRTCQQCASCVALCGVTVSRGLSPRVSPLGALRVTTTTVVVQPRAMPGYPPRTLQIRIVSREQSARRVVAEPTPLPTPPLRAQQRTWNLPVRIMDLTPLKNLYFSPTSSKSLIARPLTVVPGTTKERMACGVSSGSAMGSPSAR